MHFERFVSEEVIKNRENVLNNLYTVFHKLSNDVIHFCLK